MATAGEKGVEEEQEERLGVEEAEQDLRANAVVVRGHAACWERAVELLRANGLPAGLLPLDDMEEAGFVEATGYFWVRQKKAKQHHFPLISKTCHYAQEISGHFQKGCLRGLAGVKSKEALLLWFAIADIFTNPSKHPGEIYFKTQSGLGKWLPAEAFALPS